MEQICQALNSNSSSSLQSQSSAAADDDAPPLQALQQLLNVQPELLQTRDRLGDLPLHAACSSRYDDTIPALHSLKVVQLLIQFYPQALSLPNAHGMLPLHIAAWSYNNDNNNNNHHHHTAIIHYLMEQYPPALQMTDDSGYRPLSFLLAKLVIGNVPWNTRVIKLFLQKSPSSLWQLDKQGVLPLQYIPVPGKQLVLLQLYMECTCTATIGQNNNNGLLQAVTEDGKTPMHVAVASNTKLDLCKLLHTAEPNAIQVPDHRGRLPLHSVLTMNIDFTQPNGRRKAKLIQQKVHWVLEQEQMMTMWTDPTFTTTNNATALTRQDCHGKTPLHLLLENYHHSLMKNITERPNNDKDDPMDCDNNDDNDMSLLLPFATTNNSRLDIRHAQKQQQEHFKALLQALLIRKKAESRHACCLADDNGNLPLHLAVMMIVLLAQQQQQQLYNNNNDKTLTAAHEMVEWILTTNPGAIDKVNFAGWTPLQLAVFGCDNNNNNNNNGDCDEDDNNHNNNHSAPLSTLYTLIREMPYCLGV